MAGGFLTLDVADVVMVTYSATERTEEAVIRRAAEMGKGVLIKKGLGSGTLAGTSAAPALEESFRPIFALPGVSSLIIGTINPAHLRDNAHAVAALG